MPNRVLIVMRMVFVAFGVLWALTTAAVAQTSSEAPYADTYYCYTTLLERDPYANNPIAPRPAPFGKLVLDSKGGYTLTAKGQKGRYVYEPRLGKLSFTGLLATMQVSDYSATAFKLNYRSANGTYAFNCTTDGASDPRAKKKATAQSVQQLIAGRFSAENACLAGEKVVMDLQLSADGDNNVEGVVVLRFSGASRRPPARYAVKGRWFNSAYFTLRPQNWIENRENLSLPDGWMSGEVYEDGLQHVKTSESCVNFALRRVG